MKKIFITGFIFFNFFQLHSQTDIEYYNKGVGFFNEQNYYNAIEQFNEAIKLNPNIKDFYFNRGVAYYNLGDTCNACDDFKNSLQLGDLEARNLIMLNCIKCDEISYRYFLKAQIAVKQEKYKLADSLLTLSIETNHYLENHFQRGLVRYYLTDTLGFCKDMRILYSLDDAAKINCDSHCTDTLFFDKTFTQRVDNSDYYEVIYKPGFGALYNMKNKSSKTNYTNTDFNSYWVNDYMISYYNIINNRPVYLIAAYDRDYSLRISNFFNTKKLKDPLIEGILNRNDLNEYKCYVQIIVSTEGKIIDVVIPTPSSQNLLKFKDSSDLEELNEIIYNKIIGLSKTAPIAKPARVEKRVVNFEYNLWISLEI